ncbi:hypothetical protein POVWA2_024280 [Plasmodium ovale wallikeri]|uniref:Uncharacterized protein n=1 Tax=Plasmodium ovale wallikeri TaxID=864142 RepID=A0A1A8YUS5_PLAOA|nr:hypothetical protein POVWA1_024400 [Plasmodium ovale wallikeri]SBT35279.1 hypothetical protein POVWA2_024280 [Plasmodium ovale wallikeri]
MLSARKGTKPKSQNGGRDNNDKCGRPKIFSREGIHMYVHAARAWHGPVCTHRRAVRADMYSKFTPHDPHSCAPHQTCAPRFVLATLSPHCLAQP